jgi:hypothetical protein
VQPREVTAVPLPCLLVPRDRGIQQGADSFMMSAEPGEGDAEQAGRAGGRTRVGLSVVVEGLAVAGLGLGEPPLLRRDDAAAGPDGTDEPALPGERARPWWVTMAIEVSHCGSGCTLGDVISEFAIFGLGLTIAGVTLGAEYVGDYIFALVFGIIFQFFAIAPMRGLGVKDGLIAAAKADVISLTAFEIGLFGWMAIMAFVLFPAPHHLMPSSAAYWLLMQIGMIIGYFSSWPVNVWLIKRGIKVPM